MQKNHGFTLIEVLVSVLLFSFGILGLVALQAQASKFSVDAEDRTRAALLANEMIATLWLENKQLPSDSAKTAWIERVKNTQISGLVVKNEPTIVQDTNGVTTITISWQKSGKKPNETASQSQYTTSVVIP